MWAILSVAAGCARKTTSAGEEPVRPARNSADSDAPRLALSLVARGLGRITDVQFVPTRPSLAVVLGQDGKAQLVDLSKGESAVAEPAGTVLDLSVDSASELGLLGLAFHPDYASNGRLFVHYNPKGKQRTRLGEFALPIGQLGKQLAVEKRVLLEIDQPYSNHNGGQVTFGPDRKLYLGLGDGGAGGDPHDNAQNLGTWLGKILRLEVDGERLAAADNPFVSTKGAKPEVFAYGLRNPWKLSFDERGRMIVADVGQNKYEEVDLVAAGDNLGWRVREAMHCFKPASGCKTEGLVDPVFEYGRELGQSITGGHVYTGQALSNLKDKYVLADYVSGRLWALALPDTPGNKAMATVLGQFDVHPTAFARDSQGELYVGDYATGRLFKLTPESATHASKGAAR